YRGHRKKDNQPVILKMLKQDYPTPLELTRYRQEYEITKSLNLDGVIKTYDLEKYKNTLVIVLEDFGAESLKAAFVQKEAARISVSNFLSLTVKIADALGQIHTANIIHKDINPANLVWNQRTKQLKIIDFSIASLLPRENPTLKNPEQLEGTLAYISPEQTGRMNRALDYRTDLYSLGVTFYELLTGTLPFESESPLELVHCHIAKTPVPVSEINPDVPPIVSDIVMKLMAKNVEDRYQSAFGVKADLEKCIENSESFENIGGLSFELAQNDFSGKFKIPQKLYGRENEVNTLLQAFERVSSGAGEMMLIAGYSGVGKTALVHEVHKPMTSRNGYFASGKFDQFQRNIPYSALTTAFNEFCHYLLTENTEVLKQWRDKIISAVGNNGQVLIDIIPQLELVIGPQPAVAQVGLSEAQNRFNWVFQNFFRALCQKNHPLLLFIDDMQWADLASLNLLKRLLTDTNSRYFLFIGAYRDNEVDVSHPLMTMVEDIHQAQVTVNTISLQNLFQEDVKTLIADALKCEPNDAQKLMKLVHDKTQGNAFFTHEFLKSLYEQALLVFVISTQKGQWELDKIAALSITDNVVELMVRKIKLLSPQSIETVKLASCIGNSFDLKTLSIIGQSSQSDTLSHLFSAVEEGLIIPQDDNYKHALKIEKGDATPRFQFQHDRVQQAAYFLIDETDKQATHLAIGRLLLVNIKAKELEDRIFDIVNQFNEGAALLEDEAEKTQLADLNLLAGQKAKAAMAYETASKYLNIGRQCLSADSWDTQYHLTLNLYLETVTTEYLNTHYEQTAILSKVVLQKARTTLEKLAIYETQIQLYIAQNQQQTAIETGLQTLQLLGVPLSNSPPPDIQIKELYNLPWMTAPHKLAAMRILMTLFAPAVITNPALLSQLAFTMLKLCLQEGNSQLAAFAYSFYGSLLCGRMGNIELGYQFGKLALQMLKLFNAREIKCKVDGIFNYFIRHWKEPTQTTLQALSETTQVGLETGDIQHAGYAAIVYCSNIFSVGKSLENVHQEQIAYIGLIQKTLKQEYQLYYSSIWGQFVFNLRGLSADKFSFKGDIFDETQTYPILIKTNNLTSLFTIFFVKSMLHYWFKDYLAAVNFAVQAKQYEQSMAGLLPFAEHKFYYSLALLAQYPNVSPHQQKETLGIVAENQDNMKIWAHHAPMNFQHKYDLVEAEKARVLEQDLIAMDLYEKGIAGAKENEYLHEEALAYELAAEFYLGRGMEKFAQTYLKEAHYRYQQWGAMAKVTDLEERYPQWLVQKKAPAMPTLETFTSSTATIMASTRTRTHTSIWLDLESVMKAAQTLSGEV
ncbi:MAG TPA: serine/threonine-protein kinase PknK, partial [Thiotrichaceae bacterium]|nr:serine/threonine-protein kinase PknK [Thiotrichaceae bacterium]